MSLVRLGSEQLQRLAGSLLAIADHLLQLGQLGSLLTGAGFELADLLCQRLVGIA
ncbi:hypothetical protein D3C84_1227290 [compost metagenome]